MINVGIRESYFWKRHHINGAVIFLKGYIYSHTISDIINHINALKKENIENFINSLDGNFAIVVQKEEFTFIAVDKIRSTPIFLP